MFINVLQLYRFTTTPPFSLAESNDGLYPGGLDCSTSPVSMIAVQSNGETHHASNVRRQEHSRNGELIVNGCPIPSMS